VLGTGSDVPCPIESQGERRRWASVGALRAFDPVILGRRSYFSRIGCMRVQWVVVCWRVNVAPRVRFAVDDTRFAGDGHF